MEQINFLLHFLVILAVVLIATCDVSGGQILNYDEDPPYPWERVVYRKHPTRVQKRNATDDTGRDLGNLITPMHYNNEVDMLPYNEGKRISSFDEKMSELKKYGKDSSVAGVKVIYGRVSVPVIVIAASYPDPNQ